MKENNTILKRQDYKIKFNNKDMDFCFNWMLGIGQIIGMSAGELFYIASGIRDGNPTDWCKRFNEHADYLEDEVERVKKGWLPRLNFSFVFFSLFFHSCGSSVYRSQRFRIYGKFPKNGKTVYASCRQQQDSA